MFIPSARFALTSCLILLGTVMPSAAQTVTGVNGLTLTEIAREPIVRNGVAVAIDEQNRVFVTSVVRRKAADLDIRRFFEWVETDLSLTSVDAKAEWFQTELTPENSGRYEGRFEDANRDGSFDWKDLTVLDDMVTLLEDSEGIGRLDTSIKFNAAENTIVTGIAAGLAAWDGSLYATVEPDLVRLTDTTGDGVPNHREVLATGFSIHVGYGGHNFSGPIIGPDGRLYAAVADRGLSVTTKEGNSIQNPLSGAIVRSELDGSNMEMFAYGLRNVHEPAFDAFGNLLGVDNDGDFKGEKERFVYITEGSDTGWRMNWQFRGEGYLPWMDEGLYIPYHADQPTYLTPPIQTYLDGPAGFVFNPGTALGPTYRDSFFLARFPSRQLNAFRTEFDGAGLKMVDSHVVHDGILAVGLEFGADGGLYLADWSSTGYDMNEKGGLWKLDDLADSQSDLRLTTAALIGQDWSKPALSALRENLAHPDQRVRMKAQFELVKRDATDVLQNAALDAVASQLSRLHAIWGLGQKLRHGQLVSDDSLRSLLTDQDAEVRAQIAKVIGEATAPSSRLSAALIPLLRDDADRPRFFAAIALGRLGIASTSSEILAYLERDGTDTNHRHAAVMGLVGTTPAKKLAALNSHAARHVRLNAIVALRRLGSPYVAEFLADSDPLVVAEAASAIHDDESIPAALPALASLLDQPAGRHSRSIRRALGAAVRLRSPEQAARVAKFAGNSTQPESLRLLALDQLNSWTQPPNLDSVEGRYRPLSVVAAEPIGNAIAPHLMPLMKSADFTIAEAAWSTADNYDLSPAPADLVIIAQRDAPIAAPALEQLTKLNHPDTLRIAKGALASPHATVRQQALRSIAQGSPDHFIAAAQPFIDQNAVPESRASFELMAASSSPEIQQALRGPVARFVAGNLNPALSLDVLLAAETSTDSRIKKLLATYQAAKDPADPLGPYIETMQGGDAAHGQSILETSVIAQCTLCHRIGKIGSTVGPRLTKIGDKPPEYLLEALVNPGAVVAMGFGFTSVSLQDGTTLSGTLIKETKSSISLKLADGVEQVIPLATIASRTPAMSSMPPMGTLVSKRELRDILAYLQTLK